MSETIGKIHASRLAQAFSLAAARGWALAPRAISIAELGAGLPLADAAPLRPGGGIEQGTALVAYFVRRERRVLPAAIVMIGSRELLDWAHVSVSRSAPALVRMSLRSPDGDAVLVLTPPAAVVRRLAAHAGASALSVPGSGPDSGVPAP